MLAWFKKPYERLPHGPPLQPVKRDVVLPYGIDGPPPDQAGWVLAQGVQRFGENVDRRVWNVHYTSGPRASKDCEGEWIDMDHCGACGPRHVTQLAAQQTHSR